MRGQINSIYCSKVINVSSADLCTVKFMTLTWPGIAGGGGQKYGLLNRGSAILRGKKHNDGTETLSYILFNIQPLQLFTISVKLT